MGQQNNNSTGALTLPDVGVPFKIVNGSTPMLSCGIDKSFTSQCLSWTFTPDGGIGQIFFGTKGELTVSAPDAASSPLTVNGNTSSFVMAQTGAVTLLGSAASINVGISSAMCTIDGVAGTIQSGSGGFKFNGNKVVGARKTGWTAWTGTGSRATKAVSTATTADCAAAIKFILDDLGITSGHGLFDA